jgi:drug/metabolite transporter (DMT)-like permease
LWGTGFVFGKWALAEMTVGQMVLFRFLFASAGLSVAYWRAHGGELPRIDRRDWSVLLAAAVIGVPLQYILQFAGLARTTVSHASLMVGVMPVLLAVAAVFYAKEKLALPGWLGLFASTAGAGLVAFGATKSDSSAATLSGDLLVVVSLFGGVVWVLLSQKLMRRYSPTATTALVIVTGTVFLAIWVLMTDGLPSLASISPRAWLSLAGMGLLATTAATLLWNWGLARVPASQAGVFVNFEPVVGVILGVALFHDGFGILSILGSALIIAAAVAVSMDRRS